MTESGVMLAPESLATAWGVNLASTTQASQTLSPVLGGARVSVTDAKGTVRAAPLLYVSPHQLNFLVPAGTSVGPATVTVMNGSATQPASVPIVEVAPGVDGVDQVKVLLTRNQDLHGSVQVQLNAQVQLRTA